MTTIKLNFNKALDAITFDQLEELRKFDNLTVSCSGSQIMKRMDQEQFEEAIEALEAGESVKILD